jgi:hypothetical protein
MFQTVRNSFLVAPALLGASVLASVVAQLPVNANEAASMTQVQKYASEGGMTQMNQVTSVSQLSDVRPTDWAFQALQSLVERYGCIVGYPDRTYRGNQALSRYEFAAGLNACLDRVNELIAAGTADLVKKEDLLALQRLQEEFAAELATLRGRVDALEARTATLEKQQFSTTTKLRGEVIFAIADTFGDRATRNGANGFLGGINAANESSREDDNTNTIFADRVRLNFDTSFTGKDLLRTRLQARNITPFSGDLTGTNMTRFGFDGNTTGAAGANAFGIDDLYYRFPIGDNLRVQVDATAMDFYNGLVSTLSPFQASGTGALSRFGRFNPMAYRSNNSGAGFTTAFKLNENFRIEAGYLSDTNSNNPSDSDGLFNGSYTAIGQIVFGGGPFSAALTYTRSHFTNSDANITSSTGSFFTSSSTALFGRSTSVKTNNYSAQVQFKLSPQLILGGWFGYGEAEAIRGSQDEAKLYNAAVFAALPDFGKKGNLLGLIVGIPPKVTEVDNDNGARTDRDTTIHAEVLYRYQVTPNIAITPGVIVLFDPEHNSNNDTQFVGVIRTTFSF